MPLKKTKFLPPLVFRSVKIFTKRVYEPEAPGEGARFLVERLWPRGVKKEELSMDGWCKDVAPSPELREWFHHDPERWAEFQTRYRAELEHHPEAWQPLADAARHGAVTLLYSSRDEKHNSALVLQAFLKEHAHVAGHHKAAS